MPRLTLWLTLVAALLFPPRAARAQDGPLPGPADCARASAAVGSAPDSLAWQWHSTMAQCGDVGADAIATLLDRMHREGRTPPRDLVILASLLPQDTILAAADRMASDSAAGDSLRLAGIRILGSQVSPDVPLDLDAEGRCFGAAIVNDAPHVIGALSPAEWARRTIAFLHLLGRIARDRSASTLLRTAARCAAGKLGLDLPTGVLPSEVTIVVTCGRRIAVTNGGAEHAVVEVAGGRDDGAIIRMNLDPGQTREYTSDGRGPLTASLNGEVIWTRDAVGPACGVGRP